MYGKNAKNLRELVSLTNISYSNSLNQCIVTVAST